MKCIACGTAMTTNRCGCGGAWLSETKLVEMAQDMKGSMVALPWENRSGTHRPCPVCAAEMLTVTLVKVELDRCAPHGVWFDADELQRVLQRADRLPEAVLDGPDVRLGHSNSAPTDYNSGGSSGGGGWFILGAIADIIDIATD